jgi:Tol biopolymer transport system component/DNA-binding winged helix-turn-helix (wHTH) protein
MEAAHPIRGIIRFGVFEVDLRTGELRKKGLKIKLQEQPFQVLTVLLEHPGEIVTREELRQKLWPSDTFVDFDHGLNKAINKIREALGDSADNPRFVETLARRGYRFIAPIEGTAPPTQAPGAPSDSATLVQEEKYPGVSMVPRSLRRLGLLPLIGMLLAVLLLSGLALWIWRVNSNPADITPTISPLTSYSGIEDSPSFSPDGNPVAFSWNGEKQDNFDIYVKLIGGEVPHRLTTNPAGDFSPAWSPDGRWIAFIRQLDSATGKTAVLLIPPIGGPERQVAETCSSPGEVFFDSFLAWSPDSNWLAIVDKDASNEHYGLFLLSIETGEKRRLTRPPLNFAGAGDRGLAFSPDGRTLAFCRWGVAFATSDLYQLSLSKDLKPTGEPKRLTFDNRVISGPLWTPDGLEIIFSSASIESGGGLWRMAVSGGRPQRLAGIGEDGRRPAISHQGHRLAYTRFLGRDTDIWRVEIPGPHREANPPRNFISSTREDADPQYSPDGRKIAFCSNRSRRDEIWVCDSDGSNALRLTSLGGTDPRWSPDSQRLVFDSNAGGESEIYVVGVNGGKPQQLTSGPASNQNPYWSHDGRWIYFDSNGGREGIWKVSAQGGEAVLVTRNGWGPVESPDGSCLYYVRGQPTEVSLWKVPVGGGEESQVLESLCWWNAFDVVEGGIYLIPRPGPGGGSFIQFLNFATRSVKQIAAIKAGSVGCLSVSPDRRWILYTPSAEGGSDLMLVENFR